MIKDKYYKSGKRLVRDAWSPAPWKPFHVRHVPNIWWYIMSRKHFEESIPLSIRISWQVGDYCRNCPPVKPQSAIISRLIYWKYELDKII